MDTVLHIKVVLADAVVISCSEKPRRWATRSMFSAPQTSSRMQRRLLHSPFPPAFPSPWGCHNALFLRHSSHVHSSSFQPSDIMSNHVSSTASRVSTGRTRTSELACSAGPGRHFSFPILAQPRLPTPSTYIRSTVPKFPHTPAATCIFSNGLFLQRDGYTQAGRPDSAPPSPSCRYALGLGCCSTRRMEQ